MGQQTPDAEPKPVGSAYPDRGFIILAVLILLIFLVLTIQRNQVWRGGSLAVWTDAAEKSPMKLRPRFNRGMALLERGREEEALKDWLWVIEHSSTAGSYQNPNLLRLSAETNIIGLHLGRAQQAEDASAEAWASYREAAHVLEAALQEFPASPFLLGDAVILANAIGEHARALAFSEEAMARFPKDGPPDILGTLYWNRALALNALGRCLEAHSSFDAAIHLNPDFIGRAANSCEPPQ